MIPLRNRYFWKRVFDITLVILLLPAVAPVIFLTALSVFLFFGRPILFSQDRPGFNGNMFTLFKFRTMTNQSDESGALLPDAARLTHFGKFLRSTSLDEFPGFLNVLRGDLSFVGPRPLLLGYLPLYTAHQMRRHDVKPGITGWAQVNGRNNLSWEEKFELDIWYVDHQSFWLDLKILFLTAWKVVARRDISQSGVATMPVFTGTKSVAPEKDL